MKKNLLVAAALGGLLTLGMGAAAYAAPGGPPQQSASPGPNRPAASPAALTADDAAALTVMRDEERMARDLYKAIANRYDQALPFANITTSEQRHFDAIGVLLDRYDLADPAAGKPAGTYANAEIQSLYDGWWKRAQTSLDEAYTVGVELETRDIADLKAFMADSEVAAVDRVLGHLLAGSENHLQAFTDARNGDVDRHAVGGTGTGPRANACGRGNGRGSR